MALRTDFTDATATPGVHAAAHNDVNTRVNDLDTNALRKDTGGTVTGNVTLTGQLNVNGPYSRIGDSQLDVLEVQALEIEIHTRSQTLGYTNGKLTSVTEKVGADTVKTTTLNYSGDRLSNTVEVYVRGGGLSNRTVTTTLNYDGSGNLTGTTRTVA